MWNVFGNLGALMSCLLVAVLFSSCAGTSSNREPSSQEKAINLLQVGNAAMLEGDYAGALAHLMRAEAIDDSIPEIYHSKALVFLTRKDVPQAMKELRRALELAPDYAEANNTYGKLLLDAGKYEDAQKYLGKAAENQLYRDAYKALTALGILHYRSGNFSRAQTYLDRAINNSPQLSCIAYYYRGHLRIRESRFKEAVRDYDLGTRKLCAAFGDAHLALGIAYVQSRQYDLARKKFLEVQERFPNTDLAERAMGQLRYLP